MSHVKLLEFKEAAKWKKNPKFGSQKISLFVIKSHNFSEA